jgi:hypothetical protein
MDAKTAAMKAAMERQAAKGVTALGRKVRRRREVKPAGELHREWAESMKAAYPDAEVQPWGGAEMKLASTLVKNEGFDRAVEAIRHFIATWNNRRRDDSLPGFKLFWVFRERVLYEVDGRVMPPRSMKDRLGIGEFDRSKPDNPDVVSWSDMLGSGNDEDSGTQG